MFSRERTVLGDKQCAWRTILSVVAVILLRVSVSTAQDRWDEWTPWDLCDVSCGGDGTTARIRECLAPDGDMGFNCEGEMMDFKSCGHQPCGGGGRGPPRPPQRQPPPQPPPQQRPPPPPQRQPGPPPPNRRPPPPPPRQPRPPPPRGPAPPPRQPPPAVRPPPPPRPPARFPEPPPRPQQRPPAQQQPAYEDLMLDRPGAGLGPMDLPGMRPPGMPSLDEDFSGGLMMGGMNEPDREYDNDFPLDDKPPDDSSGTSTGHSMLFCTVLVSMIILMI